MKDHDNESLLRVVFLTGDQDFFQKRIHCYIIRIYPTLGVIRHLIGSARKMEPRQVEHKTSKLKEWVSQTSLPHFMTSKKMILNIRRTKRLRSCCSNSRRCRSHTGWRFSIGNEADRLVSSYDSGRKSPTGTVRTRSETVFSGSNETR